VQDCAVIRLIDGGLAWYSPGAGDTPRPLDLEENREQLKVAVAQPGSTAYFAAPGTDVRLCQLAISPEEKKHIDKSLPFMLEEGIVAELDELHFASMMQGKSDLIAAVCANSKMHEWQALLADFDSINHWIPEPLLLPWQSGEWSIVIEASQALVRTGLFQGFAIELALLPAALESALQAGSGLPQAVIIYGLDQDVDTAYVPAEMRDIVQWRRGGMGAALMLGQSDALTFNLLQGDFAVRLPLQRWWKQWRAVAAVLLVAFCIQMVATWAEFASLKRQNEELRLAVEQSYRKAYPQGVMVDAEKQLKRKLAGLRGSGNGSGFVSMMSRVGEVIAARPGTGIASINYNDKGDEIRMNILASDFEAVEDIRTAMIQAGLGAQMESSNAQGDKVRARMRIASENRSKGS